MSIDVENHGYSPVDLSYFFYLRLGACRDFPRPWCGICMYGILILIKCKNMQGFWKFNKNKKEKAGAKCNVGVEKWTGAWHLGQMPNTLPPTNCLSIKVKQVHMQIWGLFSCPSFSSNHKASFIPSKLNPHVECVLVPLVNTNESRRNSISSVSCSSTCSMSFANWKKNFIRGI